jgi:hypothetical protein
MQARAYTRGEDVVFGHPPSLHTVAHEAAHVVQQRHGVQLAGGVGRAGDAYEKHADAVASRVTGGGDAEPLLDRVPGASASSRHGEPGPAAVQMEPVTGVAIAGLVVAIVAALTGIGSLAYSVHQAQNNQRSGGTRQLLGFGEKYFITGLDKTNLKAILETLIRMHLDRLDPGWDSRGESDQLTQAKTRAENDVQSVMARKAARGIRDLFWWKGDDTRGSGDVMLSSAGPVGGYAAVSVFGGTVAADDFPGLTEAAERHRFDVGQPCAFLERVVVDGDGNTVPGFEDDFCFVRPGEFAAQQAGGEIRVTGAVYFDWDGNTTTMEWHDPAIGHDRIPQPRYDGTPDP